MRLLVGLLMIAFAFGSAFYGFLTVLGGFDLTAVFITLFLMGMTAVMAVIMKRLPPSLPSWVETSILNAVVIAVGLYMFNFTFRIF